LQRENLQALPSGQRSLMTLVLRKLLASSTFAIAGALTTMSNRLKAKLRKQEPAATLEEELDQDYEALDETAEEWDDDVLVEVLTEADRKAIELEIKDLDAFAQLATSIHHNAKGKSLLQALRIAFAKAQEIGAAQKAIIFTESRRTQDYLLRLLADSPYHEGIVLFNGSNSDERSKQIYAQWLVQHQGSDRITGSRTADMRSALVDYFRDQGRIMIATEAGAEGINLQFCSLVVNYDLPWNPQRIEQRIGRCHRYGQKHDVVVVNFINQNNAADQRVFELLDVKFKLFEGVFGASDEVLGAIESGVDFEKRIAAIYHRCRKPNEIQSAFDQLQLELSLEIDESLARTRQKLLEHFDDEVREKLRIRDDDSKEYLNRYERLLMQLTRHELNGNAEFVSDDSFRLTTQPFPAQSANIPLGLYELPRRSGDAHLYRLNHPLAEGLISCAKNRALPPAEITIHYSKHEGKISSVEALLGQTGWLSLSLLSVESLNQSEDHIICAAITDSGQVLDEEVAIRLLTLPGNNSPLPQVGDDCMDAGGRATSGTVAEGWGEGRFTQLLNKQTMQRQTAIQHNISERNTGFFEAEADKLDGWADDLKVGLERELKEIERQIKEARRAATIALTLEEKLAGQKQIKALEAQRSQKRKSLFDAQDQIDKQRDELIAQIESKLVQGAQLEQLFSLHWRVV
jgi:adenine-specific DNA-methyltransferase